MYRKFRTMRNEFGSSEINLIPRDPLSQVVFVHDYIQMRFQESVFNLYNSPVIEFETKILFRDDPGFCDKLVDLIDNKLIAVSDSEDYSITMTFENGTVVAVQRSNEFPEAWEFSSKEGIVVEAND